MICSSHFRMLGPNSTLGVELVRHREAGVWIHGASDIQEVGWTRQLSTTASFGSNAERN